VFGLDHILSGQEAAPEEIDAIKSWLKREGHLSTCRATPRSRFLVMISSSVRWNTCNHGGPASCPRQQRFGPIHALLLMTALDIPVINQWGFAARACEWHTEHYGRSRRSKDLDKFRPASQRPPRSTFIRICRITLLTGDDGKNRTCFSRGQPIDP